MFFNNSKEKIVKKQSKKGKILKSVNKTTKIASFRKVGRLFLIFKPYMPI